VADRGRGAGPDLLDRQVLGRLVDDPLVEAGMVRVDQETRWKAPHRLVLVDRDRELAEAFSVVAFADDLEFVQFGVVGEAPCLLVDLPGE
jgi:hypothetical protein